LLRGRRLTYLKNVDTIESTTVFRLNYRPGAVKDLTKIPKHYAVQIVDSVEEQLPHQALVPTKHRKPMPTLVPSFEHVPPVWQLSVGDYRIFYDVDEVANTVFIRAVLEKPPHSTTEDIL
jgi:mRNA-degrading endonuclease RelE of RelBE toxin-antitoxin system